MENLEHTIRKIDSATSDQDFEKLWSMWQTIFPKWPIERERLQKIMYQLPGLHYIHEKGFCLSYLINGTNGKIAAVGVLPEYRAKGLGTAFLELAQEELRKAAHTDEGGELKTLEIGSQTPRFWPELPVDFPKEVKDFFVHRGFHKKTGPTVRDYFKDIRQEIVPPEILEKVSKTKLKLSPWSPKLYEECMTKQKTNFSWWKGYEILAAYGQYDQVMVALDPETNEQLGWTFMCSPNAIVSDSYAFMPLMPSKEKTGLIAAVGVDKSARGKGVAMALLVKALENLKERGIEGVYIDSVILENFYEKLGFHVFWEYEGYVW